MMPDALARPAASRTRCNARRSSSLSSLPSDELHPYRRCADLGGLLSHVRGPPRQFSASCAAYADRILAGEQPGVAARPSPSQARACVINLKTAKALGLTVPDKLLSTADEVIE